MHTGVLLILTVWGQYGVTLVDATLTRGANIRKSSTLFNRGGSLRKSLLRSKNVCEVKSFEVEGYGDSYVYDYDELDWERGMWFRRSLEDGRMSTERVDCGKGSGKEIIRQSPEKGLACVDEKCFTDPVWEMNIRISEEVPNKLEKFHQNFLFHLFNGTAYEDFTCRHLRKALCARLAEAKRSSSVQLHFKDDSVTRVMYPKVPVTDERERKLSPMAAANLDYLIHHKHSTSRFHRLPSPGGRPRSDDKLPVTSYESSV